MWNLIQRCWDGEKTRRPRVQEVVEEIGGAAADWHTDVPPGDAAQDLEASDVEEDSDELRHSEFTPFPVVLSDLRPTVCAVGIF